MCAGAILQARIRTLVFGAWDINWGNASDFPYGQGVQGGSDLPVSAGTYDVYFNDLTGQYLFIEK